MDYEWKTQGHSRIKRLLDLQVQAQSPAHAYLFSGPVAVGKRTLALEYATRLQNVERLDNHPDLNQLNAADDGGVETVRQFISRLSTKPFVGPYTIGLIDNAAELTHEAANALLKTLEEPKPSVVLFLIASGPVLPTIASRCQTISFNRLTRASLGEFAEAQKLTADAALISFCAGRPGLLQKLLQEPDYREQLEVYLKHLSTLQTGALTAKLEAVRMLAEAESSDLVEALSLLLEQEPAQKLSSTFVSKVFAAIASLKHSGNKKLALQQLVI